MKDIHGGNIWGASAEAGIEPAGIMDFSASINPLGLSPKAKEAIRRALKLIPPYPDPKSTHLVKALSDFHGIPSEEILPGNGSTEFIYLIPQIYRPKKALIVEPAFSEYRASLKLCGCGVEEFILKEKEGFNLDIEGLEKQLKRGYDLLYISNPANPTGTGIKKDKLLRAARACKRAGTVLVLDEAFADFHEEGSVKKEAAGLKNVIILRSMTKFFSMAGLRLGFIIAHRQTIERFSRVTPPWSVNTLASYAGAGSLKDSGYIRKTHKWLAEERAFLLKGMEGIRGLKVYPSAANFFMLKINTPGITAPVLKERMFRKGIMIRDLSAFKGLGPRHFRIAVKSRKDNGLLLDALRDVF